MRFKCIVVIAALAYDFENSHLLRCAGLSKSTKMRQRMVEMCVTRFFFYKEPTSRPSSKSSLFIDLKSANCSTKSSLIVP